MNILLVDDNVDYLRVLREALRAEGHIVYTAEDGSEACKLLTHPNLDLIISDIRMPTLDGTMLHAFARETDRYRRTKFIFVSAYLDAYSDVLDLDPEVDFFIDKTTHFGEMLRIIEEITHGSYTGMCA